MIRNANQDTDNDIAGKVIFSSLFSCIGITKDDDDDDDDDDLSQG